jgi:hypothetical protein
MRQSTIGKDAKTGGIKAKGDILASNTGLRTSAGEAAMNGESGALSAARHVGDSNTGIVAAKTKSATLTGKTGDIEGGSVTRGNTGIIHST